MRTGERLLRQADLQAARRAQYAHRKLVNRTALALSLLAMGFGLFWLFWILLETIWLGVGGLSFATLTQMTPPPNDEGGLANAIYGSFLMVTTEGINYLIANNVNAPLNNADARKAISYAIDRDAIIKGVLNNMQVKATTLTPPPFAEAYQPGVCASCVKQDPAKARELAARGGLTPGTVVNFYFAAGGGHEAWVAAAAQQITDVLGVKVNVQSLPNQQMGKAAKAPDASGLFRSGFTVDYPSPVALLQSLLTSSSGDNVGRYSNPQFDKLVADAQATRSDAQRAQLVKNAEKLAIGDDQALIPLWYRSQYRVFDSSKFTGVRLDLATETLVLPEISLR